MAEHVITESQVNRFIETVLLGVSRGKISANVTKGVLAHVMVALANGNIEEATLYMSDIIARLDGDKGTSGRA